MTSSDEFPYEPSESELLDLVATQFADMFGVEAVEHVSREHMRRVVSDAVASLIEAGLVTFSGVDVSGELTFEFTEAGLRFVENNQQMFEDLLD